MKHGALFLLLLFGCDSARDELRPHWATFKTPYDDERDNIRISLPPGFSLCSVGDSPSNSLWYHVPLDQKQRCEDWRLETSWDEIPDFVVVAPSLDTPMMLETLDDYIRDDDIFCSPTRTASKTGRPSESKVPAVVQDAGIILIGYRTTACTREDIPATDIPKRC